MAGNIFGTALKISTFGESHGPALGVVIDGLESGFTIDIDHLQKQMNRRRPGGNPLGTKRQEGDSVEILSGIFEGKTTGAPVAILIRNTNQRSSDYNAIAQLYRPGHADHTWQQKFGIRDWRGGGRSSGRETAARLAAGAIAMQILASKGVTLQAYTIQIGSIVAKKRDLSQITKNKVSTVDAEAALLMEQLIERVREEQDSVGGIIECIVNGLPVGLGEPVFNKVEALLGHAILSIGATKGIEFGAGFAVASMYGSENNDQIDKSGFLSNHAGGMNGGITNGEPLIFRTVIKPTASIGKPQKSVDIHGQEHTIIVEGRHDPSICVRIVPVIEAMTALTLLSLWYEQYGR
ncbi:MAG: chorismate synthase [Sphaerochaetaceae bacterium]|nr:chorismate synthase [Sphaerochaetaceae bacterium]MDD5077344.1 chorismate synthase [Sphaerochaetaceae bacterium]